MSPKIYQEKETCSHESKVQSVNPTSMFTAGRFLAERKSKIKGQMKKREWDNGCWHLSGHSLVSLNERKSCSLHEMRTLCTKGREWPGDSLSTRFFEFLANERSVDAGNGEMASKGARLIYRGALKYKTLFMADHSLWIPKCCTCSLTRASFTAVYQPKTNGITERNIEESTYAISQQKYFNIPSFLQMSCNSWHCSVYVGQKKQNVSSCKSIKTAFQDLNFFFIKPRQRKGIGNRYWKKKVITIEHQRCSGENHVNSFALWLFKAICNPHISHGSLSSTALQRAWHLSQEVQAGNTLYGVPGRLCLLL